MIFSLCFFLDGTGLPKCGQVPVGHAEFGIDLGVMLSQTRGRTAQFPRGFRAYVRRARIGQAAGFGMIELDKKPRALRCSEFSK